MGIGEGGGGARTKATHPAPKSEGRRSYEAGCAAVWNTLRLEGVSGMPLRASASLGKGLHMGGKGGKGNANNQVPRDAPPVSQLKASGARRGARRGEGRGEARREAREGPRREAPFETRSSLGGMLAEPRRLPLGGRLRVRSGRTTPWGRNSLATLSLQHRK